MSSTPAKIRVLGTWWDSPKGDFPVRAIAARMRELRDSEVIHEGDEYIVSVSLYEDEVSYGRAVFVVTRDTAFMILLQSDEDWEEIKERAREMKGSATVSSLLPILMSIVGRTGVAQV